MSPVELGAVQETLLIPLYGRADLTRQGSALIDDPRSVAMVEAIDYDFAKFDGTPSLFGSVLRTRIHDLWLARWLEWHPEGTVVEIGAGLNTRYERIDNGRAHWVEIDLPDVMELRRRFFTETDRRRMVAVSILADDWFEPVLDRPGPWYFVAEAVLIYLPPDEARRVLTQLAARFPGAPIAFDIWGAWILANQQDHDTLGNMDARVRWTCDDPLALEACGLELIESCTFPEAPAQVLELILADVRTLLEAVSGEEQVQSYRQNVFVARDQ